MKTLCVSYISNPFYNHQTSFMNSPLKFQFKAHTEKLCSTAQSDAQRTFQWIQSFPICVKLSKLKCKIPLTQLGWNMKLILNFFFPANQTCWTEHGICRFLIDIKGLTWHKKTASIKRVKNWDLKAISIFRKLSTVELSLSILWIVSFDSIRWHLYY